MKNKIKKFILSLISQELSQINKTTEQLKNTVDNVLKSQEEEIHRVSNYNSKLRGELDNLKQDYNKLMKNYSEVEKVCIDIKKQLGGNIDRVDSIYMYKSQQYNDCIKEFTTLNDKISMLRKEKSLLPTISYLLYCLSINELPVDLAKSINIDDVCKENVQVRNIYMDIVKFVTNSVPIINEALYIMQNNGSYQDYISMPLAGDAFDESKHDDISINDLPIIGNALSLGYNFPNKEPQKAKVTTCKQ